MDKIDDWIRGVTGLNIELQDKMYFQIHICSSHKSRTCLISTT
jgi:hypothetical protein